MSLDFGYYSSLLGPLQTANQLQNTRMQQEMQAMQLLQNVQRQKLAETKERNAVQQFINQAQTTADDILFVKQQIGDERRSVNFRRQKDVDDFYDWHASESGWNEIQDVIRKYGSVSNARAYGNLDYYMQEYKNNLQGNPVSQRINKVRPDLERYILSSQDPEDAQFVTRGVHKRFNSWLDGESDDFYYAGQRTDYLPNNQEELDRIYQHKTYGTNITLEDIISVNRGAIIKDIMNDKGIPLSEYSNFANTIGEEEMKQFIIDELGVDDSITGGTAIGGKQYFSKNAINTTFANEIKSSLDAINQAGINDLNSFIDLTTQGVVIDGKRVTDINTLFQKYSGGAIYDNLDRILGVSPGDKTEKIGEFNPFVLNRQLIASDRVLTNTNKETAVMEALYGSYQDGTPKYNAANRMVYGVSMLGKYDDSGQLIKEEDITKGEGKAGDYLDWYDEDRVLDLQLNGFHIGLRISGKDANGELNSFLLKQTDNPEDLQKIKNTLSGDTQIEHVLMAEFRDDDVGPDDFYYDVVDLGDSSFRMALNEKIDPADLNNVKTQALDYEMQQKRTMLDVERKMQVKNKVAAAFGAASVSEMDNYINTFDSQLTMGLTMANVPSGKISSALPLVFTDLYTNAMQEREYPFQMQNGQQVQNSAEYMAVSAKLLKESFYKDGANGMVEAIKKGPTAYDEWSKKNLTKKEYNSSKKIRKDIIKYFNS